MKKKIFSVLAIALTMGVFGNVSFADSSNGDFDFVEVSDSWDHDDYDHRDDRDHGDCDHRDHRDDRDDDRWDHDRSGHFRATCTAVSSGFRRRRFTATANGTRYAEAYQRACQRALRQCRASSGFGGSCRVVRSF